MNICGAYRVPAESGRWANPLQACIASRGRCVPLHLRKTGNRFAAQKASSTAHETHSLDYSIVDGQFASAIPSYPTNSASVSSTSQLLQSSPITSSTSTEVLWRDSSTSTANPVSMYSNIMQHIRHSNGNESTSTSSTPNSISLDITASVSSSGSSSVAAKTGLCIYGAGATGLGRRHTNEDCHALAHLSMDSDSTTGWIYGGVFDGHGGAATATNLADLFHHGLEQQLQRAHRHQLAHQEAVARAFIDFDSYWAARCPDKSGSTAVVALLDGTKLLVANAGDSAAILARGCGYGGFAAHRLSTLHKPDDPDEAARIRSSGGIVERHPRVSNAWRALIDPAVLPNQELGSRTALSVTRGFGDYTFKRAFAPIISAEPAVIEMQLETTDQLLLLVSDGVTDALHDKSMVQVGLAAVEQARSHTAGGRELAQAAATAVRDTALRMGAVDNVTVVALVLDWSN